MLPRNFQRASIITFAVVAFLLGSAPPLAEGSGPAADNSAEATNDEPRHNPTVKPYGPYRLIQPPAQRQGKTPNPEPPQISAISIPTPNWTNNVYVIQKGDTLSTLAPFLKVSVDELATCSGIANPHRISIGQTLHRPGTCVAPPPAPVRVTVANSTPAPASGTVENAISFAMAQLGDPYLWGGNGPNAWDCSGLIHAAYAHAGIAISRSTKTLINEGTSVSQSNMVRGDLVFTSSGHMGMYVGNGQMVHAPRSGDVVKVSNIWSFYAARRVA